MLTAQARPPAHSSNDNTMLDRRAASVRRRSSQRLFGAMEPYLSGSDRVEIGIRSDLFLGCAIHGGWADRHPELSLSSEHLAFRAQSWSISSSEPEPFDLRARAFRSSIVLKAPAQGWRC